MIRKSRLFIIHISVLAALMACVTSCTQTSAPTSERSTPSPTWTVTVTPAISETPEVVAYPTYTPHPSPAPLPELQPGRGITLDEIKMMDEKNGWGIESGGHAVHTEDGGRTWRVASLEDQHALYYFLDTDHAWAFPLGNHTCGSGFGGCDISAFIMDRGVIWRTVDGGRSWVEGNTLSFDNLYVEPRELHFTDAQTGWFIYIDQFGKMGGVDTSLTYSDDAGENWSSLGRVAYSCRPTGMSFMDNQTVWISTNCRNVSAISWDPLGKFTSGGLGPKVLLIRNGNEDVTEINLPPPEIPPNLLDLNTGIHTDASAEHKTPSDILCGIEQMRSISATTVYLNWGCSLYHLSVSDFTFGYLTNDGGQSWHSWLSTDNEYFLDDLNGWRMLHSSSTQPNDLQRTRDGGRTWVDLLSVSWEKVDLDFADATNGWAIVTIGDQTALVYTEDQGETWRELLPLIAE